MAKILRRLAITASFFVALSATAHAAPQLLGVIASASPIKLHCSDGVCRTELSTFCLQAERETPGRYQSYAPVDMRPFTLIARDQSGAQVRVAMTEGRFRSERGYTAALVSFDTAKLQSRGLTPVALDVAAGGILVPVPEQGDPNPISDNEVRRAVAELHPTADRVFKEHAKDFEAVRLVYRLINETPETGRMAREDRENLWDRTFGESPRESVGAGAHRAADVLGYCQYRSKQGRFFSVRRCLEQRLDGMLMDINSEYWRAVQPGT